MVILVEHGGCLKKEKEKRKEGNGKEMVKGREAE